jgi:hypothetical protein
MNLTAPDSATAGSTVSTEWSEPNHTNDYLTIVPKGAKEGVTGKLAYTRKVRRPKSPLRLQPARPRFATSTAEIIASWRARTSR